MSRPRALLAASVFLGFKFPAWLWAKSFDVGFQVLIPGMVRAQNRVPIDSPLMVACRNGDVPQIRQHLRDGVGALGDRTSCTGRTPLMTAIEGGHLGAVTYLLENGADPSMGDDDRLDVVRLLVNHNASVHEVVCGKSLTMLTIIYPTTRPRTLELFHLLQNELYNDFESGDLNLYSAFANALSSGESSVDCLKFLKAAGADFSRLSTDESGQKCLLHLAANYSTEAGPIDYVFSSCDGSYVNRQDSCGWTPLHYAIASSFHSHASFSQSPGRLDMPRARKDAWYKEVVEIFKESGYEISPEPEADVFYDAPCY
ncbi:ankyrin repeat-containing domain protein [Lasiosphaeria ovina]|uniref:Ankyrin repeat-containing domain protein n=1 Tax=Lasiosphaeria ovina TaxID=92902 RepID=A0AAE0JU98_9PEZI|nr:ankyrin repeat-containing domain protein [Lasiosphaeria ovina]